MIDIKSKLDFSEIDLTAPNEVVKNIFNMIASETNDIIVGGVDEYTGPVESYYKEGGFQTIQKAVSQNSYEQYINIQDTLGPIGESINQYEAYLCTPVYKYFKYRLFYLQFGIAHYPVKVVLEQGIADEIDLEGKYVVYCRSRRMLERLVQQVLNTNNAISVMQELIRVHQIKSEQMTESIEFPSIKG